MGIFSLHGEFDFSPQRMVDSIGLWFPTTEWLAFQPATTLRAMGRSIVEVTDVPKYLEIVRSVFARHPVCLLAGARSRAARRAVCWARPVHPLYCRNAGVCRTGARRRQRLAHWCGAHKAGTVVNMRGVEPTAAQSKRGPAPSSDSSSPEFRSPQTLNDRHPQPMQSSSCLLNFCNRAILRFSSTRHCADKRFQSAAVGDRPPGSESIALGWSPAGDPGAAPP
jgi:hypothetical protein